MVVSIALQAIIRLKVPTCRFEGKGSVRSWAAGLHMTKFSTTETLDPRVVLAGPCLRAKTSILIRERTAPQRLALGIQLSGDRTHLVLLYTHTSANICCRVGDVAGLGDLLLVHGGRSPTAKTSSKSPFSSVYDSVC